ncbi:MAG: aldolase catalytic domain-containing protein [Clostridiales bacterium]|nr:aldolase catalytic domain-containing protein [Clostridiales bacterium]
METGNLQSVRKSIRVIDATLRDGGLVNSFYFTDDFVKALYRADVAAGVDYMEFGYKVSDKIFDRSKFGKWKFCDEKDIRAVVGENKTDLKICVMSDVGRVDLQSEVIPKKDSAIDLYRIATYVNQMPAAIEMVEYCHKMGYKTSCNIMAISKNQESDIKRALEELGKSPVDVIYIVDSFGSLYPEEIRRVSDMYLEAGEKYGKQIGIHAHNNQQLAFANTIEACAKGVDWLDATVSGMGRGAGNCYMEALLGFLKNPKYKLEPVLAFVREHMLALKRECAWGYDTPYLLTGLFNSHPKSAIAFMKDERTDYENLMRDLLDLDE